MLQSPGRRPATKLRLAAVEQTLNEIAPLWQSHSAFHESPAGFPQVCMLLSHDFKVLITFLPLGVLFS